MNKEAIDTLYRLGIKADSAFISKCNLLQLPTNTTVFTPFQSCNAYLIVVSGRVSVELTSRKGREVTLYSISDGETCVMTTASLLNKENYYAHAATQSPVEAISIPVDLFKKALAEFPAFTQFVLSDFANKTSLLFQLVDKITSHDVQYNLVKYLLRNHQSMQVHTNVSQIAKDIGSAREVVSRKITALEQLGMIARNELGLKIINQEKLKAYLRD